MPALGEYRDRVRILTRSLAAADGFGERVESWPEVTDGTADRWAIIEAPTGGEAPATPRQGTADMQVRFRAVAAIEAVDRLKILATGDVYAVVGVWRERAEDGGWQTVVSLSGTY